MSTALEMLQEYRAGRPRPSSAPKGDWALLSPHVALKVRSMATRHQRRFWRELTTSQGSYLWTGTTWRHPTIPEAEEGALVRTQAAIRAEDFAMRWPEKRR